MTFWTLCDDYIEYTDSHFVSMPIANWSCCVVLSCIDFTISTTPLTRQWTQFDVIHFMSKWVVIEGVQLLHQVIRNRFPQSIATMSHGDASLHLPHPCVAEWVGRAGGQGQSDARTILSSLVIVVRVDAGNAFKSGPNFLDSVLRGLKTAKRRVSPSKKSKQDVPIRLYTVYL